MLLVDSNSLVEMMVAGRRVGFKQPVVFKHEGHCESRQMLVNLPFKGLSEDIESAKWLSPPVTESDVLALFGFWHPYVSRQACFRMQLPDSVHGLAHGAFQKASPSWLALPGGPLKWWQAQSQGLMECDVQFPTRKKTRNKRNYGMRWAGISPHKLCTPDKGRAT